jgi:hypothetical protein
VSHMLACQPMTLLGAEEMAGLCTRSCGLCTPTLPLTQLWDAPESFDFGSNSANYQPQLPKAPMPYDWHKQPSAGADKQGDEATPDLTVDQNAAAKAGNEKAPQNDPEAKAVAKGDHGNAQQQESLESNVRQRTSLLSKNAHFVRPTCITFVVIHRTQHSQVVQIPLGK